MRRRLSEAKNSDNIKVRAFIVQSFDPRLFDVCPQCRKKVVQETDGFLCEQHGKVIPDRKALFNLVLDDGTETIRAVIFSDNFPKLGLIDWNSGDAEKLSMQRYDLLGKELFFSGNIRNNKFFNNTEFIIDKIEDIDLDNLVKDLESK